MTEADALDRARALLKEPESHRGSALAALLVAGVMALLAAGLVGVVVTAPAQASASASN